ncbi:MAG: type II toxin-antitoxin system RelE/ParE family toxin [Kiloniellales bacterium]|nr:type II toxin-antitoxin system RelE/ParE family toxin [Kiloniellales bacterium]
MVAPKRLIVAPSAYRDLKEIWKHVATDNPVAARAQVKRILMQADMLRDFPEMGLDRSLLAPSLRSVVVRPYVVFYYSREERIEIVRVFHGRQDIRNYGDSILFSSLNQALLGSISRRK